MIIMGKSIRQIRVNCMFCDVWHDEKTNIVIYEHVRNKPSCTSTEDDERLEVLDLESRGTVLSV